MGFPHLNLAQDPEDPAHIIISYDPPPETWRFTQRRREELREELQQTVAEFKQQHPPNALFTDEQQRALRVKILVLLLYWETAHGLQIHAKS